MVKPFLSMVAVLVVCMGGIILHYFLHGKQAEVSVERIVRITKLPSPSLSVAYYEPRVLLYEDALNPAYPQMQTMNKMDLVYEK